MPHLPRRFRSVRSDAQPSQLAPSDSVPPDLVDVYDDLPVAADPPTEKPNVQRNPVVRKSRTPKVTGMESLSMKTYGPRPEEVANVLFNK